MPHTKNFCKHSRYNRLFLPNLKYLNLFSELSRTAQTDLGQRDLFLMYRAFFEFSQSLLTVVICS